MNSPTVKTYIVNFVATGVNLAALNQYLYDSSDIIAFWNYIPLVYCVKSHLDATTLMYKLSSFFPHRTFLIAEINKENLNGMLPQPAWDWFYLEHHEKHRPPAPIGGLLSLDPRHLGGGLLGDLGRSKR
jgi:hypothetical protein